MWRPRARPERRGSRSRCRLPAATRRRRAFSPPATRRRCSRRSRPSSPSTTCRFSPIRNGSRAAKGSRRRWLTSSPPRTRRPVITISEFSAQRDRAVARRPSGADHRWRRPASPGLAPPSRAGPRGPPTVSVRGLALQSAPLPELLRGFARSRARRAGRAAGDRRRQPHAPAGSTPCRGARLWASRPRRPGALRHRRRARRSVSARAVFAFLSDYEGFGMTPLEAMARGVRRCVLDTPVAREVYGDGARWSPPRRATSTRRCAARCTETTAHGAGARRTRGPGALFLDTGGRGHRRASTMPRQAAERACARLRRDHPRHRHRQLQHARDLARACDIADEPPPATAHEVVVVDNASTDGSARTCARPGPACGSWRSVSNVGFARGQQHRYPRHLDGALVLLLNSDTIVPAGAIDGLVAALAVGDATAPWRPGRDWSTAAGGPRCRSARWSHRWPSCGRSSPAADRGGAAPVARRYATAVAHASATVGLGDRRLPAGAARRRRGRRPVRRALFHVSRGRRLLRRAARPRRPDRCSRPRGDRAPAGPLAPRPRRPRGMRTIDRSHVPSTRSTARAGAVPAPVACVSAGRPVSDRIAASSCMRIAIDARKLHDFGIGTYVRNLKRLVARQDRTTPIRAALPSATTRSSCAALGPAFAPVVEHVAATTRCASRSSVPRACGARASTCSTRRTTWCRRSCPCPSVVTIHDCIHLRFPQYLPNALAHVYARMIMWMAARRARRVLTVSEASKQDILHFCRCPAEKVEVIYNALDERSRAAAARRDRAGARALPARRAVRPLRRQHQAAQEPRAADRGLRDPARARHRAT